jgi:hypothetical protein
MEKELENPEKKKRRKQPKPAQLAQPGRAPAPPDRRTLHVSGNFPLSRALCPLGPTCRCQFSSPSRSLSLCLAGPDRQSPSCCPACPFSSLSLHRGPSLSVPPLPHSPWTGACALAHITEFLGHDARPRTQLPS